MSSETSDLKNLGLFVGVTASIATQCGLHMSTEDRQYFIEGEGRRLLEDRLPQFLKELLVQPQSALAIPQYPANNEKFELTVDGQTKWFMLVNVGYQPNWESLQAAITPHGSATGESERAAFKKKFPQADGNGPIGFTKIPIGRADFPYVYADGDLRFDWTGFVFYASWRWLVEVQAV